MCSGKTLFVYDERGFEEKKRITFESNCYDLTFYNDWILVGLSNGNVVVLDKTNYSIVFTSKLFDHYIRNIRMLKNNDIALATSGGLFFAKIDNKSIQLIDQSFAQGKGIGFYNEIETHEGYIVFCNYTSPYRLCLADRVSGKCIDLHNEDGLISVLKY